MTILLNEPTDFDRDRWGRPLIIVDGRKKPYQRPSSLGDCIDNRYNLELWKQRMVAQGLATDHAVYATACALEITDTKDNKKSWNDVVEAAMAAKRSSARAELGTALHKMTERADRGETLDLPPVFAADIAAYRTAMQTAGLTVVNGMIECRCVCDELEAAGTFDRIVADSDGVAYIGDVKTGGTADYPHGFAVQLATYAHALLYDIRTGDRRPLPANLDPTKGIIIHLPAGEARCSIHVIDLDKGWEAARTAHWVRNTWQKDKQLLSNLITISPPASVAAEVTTAPVERGVAADAPVPVAPAANLAELRERIANLTLAQRAQLKATWPKNVNLKKMDSLGVAEEAFLNGLVDDVVGPVDKPQETVTAAPDEGRDASPEAIAALGRKFQELDRAGKGWVASLTTEANAAGAGLSIKAKPSLRRFEIGRALVWLAKHKRPDLLPELIAATIGDVPGSPGALLASMGAEDAAIFARHVDALSWRDDAADGTPRLHPVA